MAKRLMEECDYHTSLVMDCMVVAHQAYHITNDYCLNHISLFSDEIGRFDIKVEFRDMSEEIVTEDFRLFRLLNVQSYFKNPVRRERFVFHDGIETSIPKNKEYLNFTCLSESKEKPSSPRNEIQVKIDFAADTRFKSEIKKERREQ